MAELAPMPSAMDAIAISEKPGFLRNRRPVKRRSAPRAANAVMQNRRPAPRGSSQDFSAVGVECWATSTSRSADEFKKLFEDLAVLGLLLRLACRSTSGPKPVTRPADAFSGPPENGHRRNQAIHDPQNALLECPLQPLEMADAPFRKNDPRYARKPLW